MKHILIDPSHERHVLDLRLLGFRDIVVLGRYGYTHAKPPLPLHDHGDMMEVCHLASGQQFYRIEEEEFFLNGGDVLVNYPHERHGTGIQREGRGTLYWMIVKPPGPRGSFLGLPPGESNRLWTLLNPLPKRHFRVKLETQKTLDKAFTLLKDRLPFERPLDESLIEDILFSMNVRNHLLRYLLDLIESSGTETLPPVCREIHLAVELIKRNDDQFQSMRAIAREIGLSESRFKHRFKEEIGISPGDYQLRHKIDLACQMLLEGSAIIDITYQLGFSSSQYFATVFRRYMGVTPAEYRTIHSPGN